MPRAKKEEVKEEKKTTKSTQKTVVDNLEKAFEEFDNYINFAAIRRTTSAGRRTPTICRSPRTI